MFKKIMSGLFVVFLLITFIGILPSFGEEQKEMVKETIGEEKIEVIKGTIISMDPDSRKIMLKTEADEMITLTANSEIELKNFKEGDIVTIVCCGDKVIKTMRKQV